MAQRTEPFVGGTSKKSINSAAKASAATESFTEKLSDIDFKAVAGRVFESVSAISEDFTKSKDALQKQAREYAKMAIEYGQKNPWALAIGSAGVGFVAGLYVARARQKKS